MTLKPVMITCDTDDALSLAGWWADQTGGKIVEENDGWFVVVQVPDSPSLAFQKVGDPTPGKNRLHLDLIAPDLDAEVARLVEAGAAVVEAREMPDFRWVTMTDPAGNEFCVASAH